jgi:hypothetical protein
MLYLDDRYYLVNISLNSNSEGGKWLLKINEGNDALEVEESCHILLDSYEIKHLVYRMPESVKNKLIKSLLKNDYFNQFIKCL